MVRWASVLLAVAALAPPTLAWSPGDVVPILERSLLKGEVTPWRTLSPTLSPRFARPKSVRVPAPTAAAKDADTDEFKMAFELGHDLGWRTPWITVATGCHGKGNTTVDGLPLAHKCHHLSEIDFVFRYEKTVFGKITGFKWHPLYVAEPVDHITLHYVWHEVSDYDLNGALHFLYGFAFFTTTILLVFLTIPTESVRRGEMLVRDSKSN